MKKWVVTVSIPADLPDEAKDDLFTHVADAVDLWEPKDRAGWDADVVAGERGYDPGEGPFSRKGWTLYSGRSIADSLADGIRDRQRRIKGEDEK